jgi:hypothetical protein
LEFYVDDLNANFVLLNVNLITSLKSYLFGIHANWIDYNKIKINWGNVLCAIIITINFTSNIDKGKPEKKAIKGNKRISYPIKIGDLVS